MLTVSHRIVARVEGNRAEEGCLGSKEIKSVLPQQDAGSVSALLGTVSASGRCTARRTFVG